MDQKQIEEIVRSVMASMGQTGPSVSENVTTPIFWCRKAVRWI